MSILSLVTPLRSSSGFLLLSTHQIEGADRHYKQLYFPLLNMGYASYDNHESLADSILSERPWDSLSQTLLDSRYRQPLAKFEDPTLMYRKPPVNTDSVLAVQEEFGRSVFQHSIVVDDPNEYSSQILQWYVEKTTIGRRCSSASAQFGPYQSSFIQFKVINRCRLGNGLWSSLADACS